MQQMPDTLIKNSAVVQMSGSLLLNQRRAYNIMLAVAQGDKGLSETISITFSDLRKALGTNTKNSTYFRTMLTDMMTIPVRFNLFNRDSDNEQLWQVHATLFSELAFSGDTVRYSFSPSFRKLLSNPRFYIRLYLPYLRKFKHQFTPPIYEYSKDMLGARRGSCVFKLSLDDFRKLCGLEESRTYSEFKHLNPKVIRKAVLEITAHTDISLTILPIKTGKTVVALQFEVVRSRQLNNNEYHEKSELVCYNSNHISIETQLSEEFSISGKLAKEWLSAHGALYVEEAIKYVKIQIEKKTTLQQKSSNIGGYLRKTIENSYHMPRQDELELEPAEIENNGEKGATKLSLNSIAELGKKKYHMEEKEQQALLLQDFIGDLGGREKVDWQIDPDISSNSFIAKKFYYWLGSNSKIL